MYIIYGVWGTGPKACVYWVFPGLEWWCVDIIIYIWGEKTCYWTCGSVLKPLNCTQMWWVITHTAFLPSFAVKLQLDYLHLLVLVKDQNGKGLTFVMDMGYIGCHSLLYWYKRHLNPLHSPTSLSPASVALSCLCYTSTTDIKIMGGKRSNGEMSFFFFFCFDLAAVLTVQRFSA